MRIGKHPLESSAEETTGKQHPLESARRTGKWLLVSSVMIGHHPMVSSVIGQTRKRLSGATVGGTWDKQLQVVLVVNAVEMWIVGCHRKVGGI